MKNLKKLSLMLVFALIGTSVFAQSIFDKFEDKDGVMSVVVNQKMFKMLATMGLDVDDPEAQGYIEMAKKITGLKVFTTGDEKISADMSATVNSYLKSSKLEELMRIKDGDQTVNFYVKEGKDENHVMELLMFVNGLKGLTNGNDISINGEKREFESVLLSLTGDIDLREISKLTSQMNMPGGEQLKKAGKNKK
ncbi:DUF4252 domain-containing protein [Subsaximicrobium wynnwilliamsii]|uniref:DUF4252 domain-containing protein n=1 Tax=Subsaximicrobium wynnwilliamsii TaxID=291179 RepID=A0A5C6ZN21_9FLAO|nr:DUF4252 domain-containing protein [Subsaximicrobium wynnwilliamsii]TXD84703.1 DUF4252 domain-containing protein [Subsaximicrobium wynnwilliamsii]TXD90373.1 DUF4252 domain-containing protein [Subsaximicrobium wynnwilliamsii]TXE04849.1 DUF4252 domain-containing protein [Subsaximicrobium wynnwilliamsii]